MVTLFKKRFHSLDDDTVSGLLPMYPNRSVTEWETMLDAEVTPRMLMTYCSVISV